MEKNKNLEKNLIMEQESIVEEIHRIIAESPEKIKQEMERCNNTGWLACLIGRISIIGFSLKTGNRINEISLENYQNSQKKLESLTEKVRGLQKQFINTDVPEETKETLLFELSAIAEDL
jgi:hypothetical protein